MIVEQSKQIIAEIEKAFIGKREIVEKVFMTIIYAGGHVLLEDCPGVGKATLALAFSRVLGLDLKRIQFTTDTLPSDITGFSVWNRETRRFDYRDGAANCKLLLAGEINRTSPKTWRSWRSTPSRWMGSPGPCPPPLCASPPRTPWAPPGSSPCRNPSWTASWSG